MNGRRWWCLSHRLLHQRMPADGDMRRWYYEKFADVGQTELAKYVDERARLQRWGPLRVVMRQRGMRQCCCALKCEIFYCCCALECEMFAQC